MIKNRMKKRKSINEYSYLERITVAGSDFKNAFRKCTLESFVEIGVDEGGFLPLSKNQSGGIFP